MPGLQAADDNECIWLRGIDATTQPAIRIRQLPGLHTYRLDEDNNLFTPGAVTPISKLKSLQWLPLNQFITVTLPVSTLPGKINQKHPVKLVPTAHAAPGNALLTDLDTWKAYAETAPLARLMATRFAVSAGNQVLILGSPLPSLPGKEYVLNNDILLPCGYEFDPPAITALITSRLNPLQDALLLFDVNGNWEKIPFDVFVASTRSAIRATKGGSNG